MSTRRERAIKRRRKFIATVIVCVLVVIGIIVGVIYFGGKKDNKDTDLSKKTEPTKTASEIKEEEPEEVIDAPDGLDAKYGNLILVNGENALPENYDSDIRADLVEIDAELRNNNYVTKIHKTVYPYITAMVKAAQNDGVDLKVWSPFRSYADQQVLFQNQVNRCGGDEIKAATVVARPGTSEHNTGICADFNMADDKFETTPMFKWMCENAENYGFILRYPKDKQDKTGVIYESWHWRFVGIENARKINKLGLCLEEYLEKNNIKQEISLDNF
ncbi:MAG: M15 family metallopeptidase [Clostridia bacterium]|nr:M15 family metallopeptidase [Clostridia bacterium]